MTQQVVGSFDLVFRPSVNLVSVVRRFVQNFYDELRRRVPIGKP